MPIAKVVATLLLSPPPNNGRQLKLTGVLKRRMNYLNDMLLHFAKTRRRLHSLSMA
jgi:hypothetical protein